MKKLLISSLVLLVAAGNSIAAVLVNWSFSVGNATSILPSFTDSANVASAGNATTVGATGSAQISGTITNLPAGGGTGTGLNYIAPYGNGTANATTGGSASFYGANGFGTSPVSTQYISFSLTMNSSIDPSVNKLEGIQFNLANAGSSGPRGVEVTYRIGTSGSFTSLGTTAVPNNTANNYGLFTFNLSSPASLSGGDVVEFRFLGYSNSASNSIRLDNVSITAVPEPAATAFLAAAGLFFVLQRVRRRMGPLRR